MDITIILAGLGVWIKANVCIVNILWQYFQARPLITDRLCTAFGHTDGVGYHDFSKILNPSSFLSLVETGCV